MKPQEEVEVPVAQASIQEGHDQETYLVQVGISIVLATLADLMLLQTNKRLSPHSKGIHNCTGT